MKKLCILILLSSFFFQLSCPRLSAQERKYVSCRLLNKDEGNKPFNQSTLIEIHAFDTEALGNDAYAILSQNLPENINGAFPVEPPDGDGFFSCRVPEGGSIVIKIVGDDGAHIEYIRGRSVIEISIAGGNRLDESRITEQFNDKINVLEEEAEVLGDRLSVKKSISIPSSAIPGPNARLVLQPYFIDLSTNDTLARMKPYVSQGPEYSRSQKRHMGYMLENDPLTPYVREEVLTSDGYVVFWRDTVVLPNPAGSYLVKGKMTVEDYNSLTLVEDSMFLASSRLRRPMQFLDYELGTFQLNAADFHEDPKPEAMNTVGSMDLKFLVNMARVDAKDTEGMARLQELKMTLHEIIKGENTWLREFRLESYSSPDGSYKKNQELSRKRLEYMKGYLFDGISKSAKDRFWNTSEAHVASWSDVADSLEKRGLKEQADEVMGIVEKYKGNHDRQGQVIRRLGYYKSTISPILEKMRLVKYTFKHEEFRPITPEEVLQRYRYDEEYSSGRKHFKVPEYCVLFKMLEERGASDDELFKLYKRAYEETAEDRATAWPYAANKYAVACIERGIIDTTILYPQIDWDIPYSDFSIQDARNPGKRHIYNRAEIIANQMQMYLLDLNYPQASILAQMLPDNDKYRVVKAITMCRGGYYKGGKTQKEQEIRERWRDIAMESSPLNKVVMLLAMNTANYDKKAEEAIKFLPEDDARTWYFKAVLSSRKLRDKFSETYWDEVDNFAALMIRCFDLDPSFVGIAYNDGDIDEQQIKDLLEKYPDYKKYL